MGEVESEGALSGLRCGFVGSLITLAHHPWTVDRIPARSPALQERGRTDVLVISATAVYVNMNDLVPHSGIQQ